MISVDMKISREIFFFRKFVFTVWSVDFLLSFFLSFEKNKHEITKKTSLVIILLKTYASSDVEPLFFCTVNFRGLSANNVVSLKVNYVTCSLRS